MKRSDLRVVAGLDLDAYEFHREVADDDLRSMAPELLAVLLDGVDAEPCLTHGSAFYDEALCGLQMARLYHETGSTLSGLAWVDEQYGECRWTEAMAEGETP